MIATAALLTLLLAPAPATAARPAPPPCQTFTRGAAGAPPLVSAWFAASGDQRVLICPQPPTPAGEAPPLYFGEGGVSRQGRVCSYASHGLAITGREPARRLQRIDRSEAVAMALALNDCPLPHDAAAPDVYVMTYDVSHAAFAGILELWLELTAPGRPLSGPQQVPMCCHLSAQSSATPADAASAASLKRLRAAAEAGRLSAGGVMRIARLPGSTLRRRYALFARDPDKVQDRPAGLPGLYVIYVQKRLRGPYEVSDVGESN
jgi:hypothetical protein